MKKKRTTKEFRTSLISKWVYEKKHNLYVCTIYEQTLGIALNLVYGKLDDFNKMIKEKHGIDTTVGSCVALALHFKDDTTKIGWNFVLIQENGWYAKDYGTICHELHHATHFAINEKGITYGDGGEELYAHTQGFFMEMVVRAFVELNKILGKK